MTRDEALAIVLRLAKYGAAELPDRASHEEAIETVRVMLQHAREINLAIDIVFRRGEHVRPMGVRDLDLVPPNDVVEEVEEFAEGFKGAISQDVAAINQEMADQADAVRCEQQNDRPSRAKQSCSERVVVSGCEHGEDVEVS